MITKEREDKTLRDVIQVFIYGSKTVIYSDLSSVLVIESRHEVN